MLNSLFPMILVFSALVSLMALALGLAEYSSRLASFRVYRKLSDPKQWLKSFPSKEDLARLSTIGPEEMDRRTYRALLLSRLMTEQFPLRAFQSDVQAQQFLSDSLIGLKRRLFDLRD